MIEEPKFSPGDKCFIEKNERGDNGQWIARKCFGIICSDPIVYNRNIGYDVLVDGQCQTWVITMLKKR